jgi:hypothetical protein
LRVIILTSQSGATVSWEADEELVLVGLSAFNVGLISLEPDLTLASWGSSLVDGFQAQLRIVVNATLAPFNLTGLSFEIPKGLRIFYAPSAPNSTVQIFFEDIESQLRKVL